MTSTAPPRLLLVHAHPDDETIWTGGTIAYYAARGVQVFVVTCTLGEEGEVIPEKLRGLASDRADQLGGYRIGELHAAGIALGVTRHYFLGGVGRWRDSGMLWRQPGQAGALPESHRRAFATGNQRHQTDALESLLHEIKPQVVITYAADGGYGHPDHVRAHEVTMAATAQVPEVLRVFHTVPPREAVEQGLRALAASPDLPFSLPGIDELPHEADESVTTVIDVGAHVPAKISALRAHATQVQVWADQSVDGQGNDGQGNENQGTAAYALSNGLAQPILRSEHYRLARGDSRGCTDDLFGGLERVTQQVDGHVDGVESVGIR